MSQPSSFLKGEDRYSMTMESITDAPTPCIQEIRADTTEPKGDLKSVVLFFPNRHCSPQCMNLARGEVPASLSRLQIPTGKELCIYYSVFPLTGAL